MTITVIGSCKGGSGKTTTCVNIAVGLVQRGYEVALVGADNQGTANHWHDRREANGQAPLLTVMRKNGNLVNTLQSLAKKYDYVLVDVGASNSAELISAMVVADQVIAPYQCSKFDLECAEELRSQLENVLPVNPTLKVMVYHAIATTNPALRRSERLAFATALEAYPEFQLLEAIGHSRKVYKDVAEDGRSVLESQNPLAAGEINALLKEVFHV